MTEDADREHTEPLEGPGIRMIETRLADAWAVACSETVATPDRAAEILHNMIGTADREHFVALYLNARLQITHAHIVSRGTTQSALVHPREVFKAAVLANATAVIVGHNHPTGDVHPSPEDNAIVERLKAAGDLLGMEVLDALIVGPTQRFYSSSLKATASLGALHDESRTWPALVETARFILDGNAGDMLEESAEILAQQVLDVDEKGLRQSTRLAASSKEQGATELEAACRGLLQDIGEVLERQGEAWWDQTVTSGTHHRWQAERLLGKTPYVSALGDKLNESTEPSCE
jgi:DNA repair protein RadC